MVAGIGRSRIVIGAILLGIPLLINYRANLAALALNSGSLFDHYERSADIPYGRHPRQKLDVFAKDGSSNRPIVIFWYGGAWIWGSKADYRFVGSALADAGYVAILPDYRLYPEARLSAVIEDGALAVQWTRKHAKEFGGDPLRIFLMGHSAGAHLAATLAYAGGYLGGQNIDPRSIRGYIGLSGPYAVDRQLLTVYTNVFYTSECGAGLAANPGARAVVTPGVADTGDGRLDGSRIEHAGIRRKIAGIRCPRWRANIRGRFASRHRCRDFKAVALQRAGIRGHLSVLERAVEARLETGEHRVVCQTARADRQYAIISPPSSSMTAPVPAAPARP